MCLRQSFLQLDSVIAMEYMIVRFVLLIVMVGAGVLLIWSARAAASGGLKRNQIAGIRTSRTLSSDAAWQTAHVRAERPTVIAGVVSVATGLVALLPVQVEAAGIAVLTGCGVMLALVLYGARVGHRAAGDLPPRSDD